MTNMCISFFHLGSPLGTFIGGAILKNLTNGYHGQLRNYVTVFAVSLVCVSTAFIWALFVVKKPKKLSHDSLVENSDMNGNIQTIENNGECHQIDNHADNFDSSNKQELTSDCDTLINEDTKEENVIVIQSVNEECESFWQSLKLLFDFQNLKDVWRTCTMKRNNYVRAQIWLMLISMCFLILSLIATIQNMMNFCEKAYHWSANYYSTMSSLTSILSSVSMVFIVPLLVKTWKTTDLNLVLIGIISWYFANVIRGSYQHPIGFFVASFVGAFGVGSIGIRARMSKIVAKEEIGKVFGLLAILESITPLLGGLVLTPIFQYSISFFPGLIFEVAAVLLLIPLFSFLWIDYYCPNVVS